MAGSRCFGIRSPASSMAEAVRRAVMRASGTAGMAVELRSRLVRSDLIGISASYWRQRHEEHHSCVSHVERQIPDDPTQHLDARPRPESAPGRGVVAKLKLRALESARGRDCRPCCDEQTAGHLARSRRVVKLVRSAVGELACGFAWKSWQLNVVISEFSFRASSSSRSFGGECFETQRHPRSRLRAWLRSPAALADARRISSRFAVLPAMRSLHAGKRRLMPVRNSERCALFGRQRSSASIADARRVSFRPGPLAEVFRKARLADKAPRRRSASILGGVQRV